MHAGPNPRTRPTPTDVGVWLAVPSERVETVLDHLAPPGTGLSLAALLPAEAYLTVADGHLGLALAGGDRRGAAAPLVLPIESPWQQPLLWVCEPVCGSAGTLSARLCHVRLQWSDGALYLDLRPAAGRRTTLTLPAEGLPDWLTGPVAPVAAALVVSVGVALPVTAAEYVVQPGDTLYGISERFLGGGWHWGTLMRQNRQQVQDPRRLMPGTRLHLPERHAATGDRIVVQPGDTLFGLARRHLGNGSRWRELWQSVRGRVARPEALPVGLVIELPGAPSHHQPQARPKATHLAPDTRTAGTGPAPAVTPSPLPSASSLPAAASSPVPVASPSPSAGPDSSPAPSPSPAGVASPDPDSSPSPAPAASASPFPETFPSPSPSPEASDSPAVAVPASLRASPPTIERPFESHVGLSYTPTNVTESLTGASLDGQATILTTVGAQAAWRALPNLEVSGAYQGGSYVVDRGTFGSGPRVEQHGRVMAAAVWPLQPNLELAAGLGAQAGFFGPAAMPVTGRPADFFDTGYQRVMADVEAKVGYRPLADVPVTLTAGVSAQPLGVTVNGTAGLPGSVAGIGWHAGVRYTLQGVALELGYRGQRVWGSGYQQSTDLLHGTVGYYFR